MELKNITIKISEDKILELTVEQAKELKALLDDTFEIKKTEINYPVVYPIYKEYPWWNPVITCDTSTSGITDIQNNYTYSVNFELKNKV